MVREEKRVSSVLSSNDTTNLVLAKFVFVGDSPANFQSQFVLGPKQKTFVFESSWRSVLSHDPSLEAAQRAIRPYASQALKTEGLSSDQQKALVRDMRIVLDTSEYYQTQIVLNFEFTDERMSPPEILN